jgi:type IV secretory pathway TraG/TraD family ATPase VirD4
LTQRLKILYHLILADEFVKMGKMTQLIKTPDLSRGQKVAVIFIVQALSQPVEVYGAAYLIIIQLLPIQ